MKTEVAKIYELKSGKNIREINGLRKVFFELKGLILKYSPLSLRILRNNF